MLQATSVNCSPIRPSFQGRNDDKAAKKIEREKFIAATTDLLDTMDENGFDETSFTKLDNLTAQMHAPSYACSHDPKPCVKRMMTYPSCSYFRFEIQAYRNRTLTWSSACSRDLKLFAKKQMASSHFEIRACQMLMSSCIFPIHSFVACWN